MNQFSIPVLLRRDSGDVAGASDPVGHALRLCLARVRGRLHCAGDPLRAVAAGRAFLTRHTSRLALNQHRAIHDRSAEQPVAIRCDHRAAVFIRLVGNIVALRASLTSLLVAGCPRHRCARAIDRVAMLAAGHHDLIGYGARGQRQAASRHCNPKQHACNPFHGDPLRKRYSTGHAWRLPKPSVALGSCRTGARYCPKMTFLPYAREGLCTPDADLLAG